MRLRGPILAVLQLSGAIALTPSQERINDELQVTPDEDHTYYQKPALFVEVRDKLIQAQIIPDVINNFDPTFLVNVTWGKGTKNEVYTDLGNTLHVNDLQGEPYIHISDNVTHPVYGRANLWPGGRYILAMTDPDVPPRSAHLIEFCHWIIRSARSLMRSEVSYKPPKPPAGSGKHRYIFVVFTNADCNDNLNCTVPEKRLWGQRPGQGIRGWAAENGFFAIAANFFYAEHEDE